MGPGDVSRSRDVGHARLAAQHAGDPTKKTAWGTALSGAGVLATTGHSRLTVKMQRSGYRVTAFVAAGACVFQCSVPAQDRR